MRVCIPIAGNVSSPRPSGILNFAVGLGAFLENAGVPVEFLCSGGSWEGRTLRVTRIAAEETGEIKFSRMLARHLASRNFPNDTVFIANTELYAWAFRRLRPRKSVVLVLHGPTYPTLKKRRPIAGAAFVRLVEPRALRLSNVVVAIDSESWHYVSQKYPDQTLREIPLPVDLGHYRPYDQKVSRDYWQIPNVPVIVFVGRLAAEKDPKLALEVHRRLLATLPAANLLLAGTGPLAPAIRRAARRIGGGSVRLLGPVPRKELPTLYSAADALLMTSRVEQLPSVLLESLACGTQVVARGVGDVGKILDDPCLGAVVGRDPEEIAAELLRRIPEKEDVRAKYVASRRRVAARYSWDRIGLQFLEVFNEALPP